MNLLIETNYDKSNTLVQESVDSNTGEKSYYIQGIFMQADVVNGNRRLYPKDVLFESLKPLKEEIKKNTLMGELNHPDENPDKINPDRACIKITELKEDGSNVMGKAKVMKSVPCGALVHGLLSEGVVIGVSSRGFGDVEKKNGYVEVLKPLVMRTIDVVTNPSAPEAYMNAVMEGKEWVYANGVLVEKEKDIKKIINESVRKNININEQFIKIIDMIAENKF